LDGNESGGSGSKETEERRLESFTIRLGNRRTILPNLGRIDVITGVDAIFEPDSTRLTSSTVIIPSMSLSGMIEDASNTNVSTPSVDTICSRAVMIPSWPAI
jgi:deoxyinosine 3'endonuclease (endonuclease V)